MPRRYEAVNASPEEIRRRIEQQFEDPSFACIRIELATVLRHHEEAVRNGATPAFAAIDGLLARYESLVPSRIGDRFALDSWVIQSLSESWSLGPIKLPRTILPIYGNEWMWRRLPRIPQANGSGHQVVSAITLKGRDRLDSINLLEYPWLCHELGHALFAKCPTSFFAEYIGAVTVYSQPILRKTFADSSDVRALTMAHVEQLRRHWLPRGDQQSWINEIGVDIVALWSCGPAFLAAMTDAVDSADIDPFVIDSIHPPYALRIGALVECAHALGWDKESVPLENLSRSWEPRKLALPNYNNYVALAPVELVEKATRWALGGCRLWQIPRCDRDVLNRFAERRRKRLEVDSAIELIVSAALLFDRDQQTYPKWESETVRRLLNELNGNA